MCAFSDISLDHILSALFILLTRDNSLKMENEIIIHPYVASFSNLYDLGFIQKKKQYYQRIWGPMFVYKLRMKQDTIDPCSVAPVFSAMITVV